MLTWQSVCFFSYQQDQCQQIKLNQLLSTIVLVYFSHWCITCVLSDWSSHNIVSCSRTISQPSCILFISLYRSMTIFDWAFGAFMHIVMVVAVEPTNESICCRRLCLKSFFDINNHEAPKTSTKHSICKVAIKTKF